MTFGPVVTGAGLAEDEVVGAEDLAVGAGADAVHGARLEIHEDGPGNKPATGGLIEVDIDPLELEVGGSVLAVDLNAVLVADDLPELGADLVAALAALNVQDFSHSY